MVVLKMESPIFLLYLTLCCEGTENKHPVQRVHQMETWIRQLQLDFYAHLMWNSTGVLCSIPVRFDSGFPNSQAGLTFEPNHMTWFWVQIGMI